MRVFEEKIVIILYIINYGFMIQPYSNPNAIINMVPPPLTKQLLQLHHPDQKYSNEAIELSTELLKLFIVEARRRAKIEVS